MKNYRNFKIVVAILSLICTSIGCKAQNVVIEMSQTANSNYNYKNGSLYIKDINGVMNPFIGTWKWTDSNRELTFYLIKQIKYHYNQGTDNYYEDRLVGYYIYKENGVIIANTSTDDLNDDYNIKLDLSFYVGIKNISINDYLKNKTYDGWFELLNPNQLHVSFKEREYRVRVKEGFPPPTNLPIAGNTFPLDIILIKQ